MKCISPEPKAAILTKLLPPYNMTVLAVSQTEGISDATLYNWCDQAKSEGKPVPGADKNSTQSPAETRFAAIVETATLSEAEVAEYCVKKDCIRSGWCSGNRVFSGYLLPEIKLH